MKSLSYVRSSLSLPLFVFSTVFFSIVGLIGAVFLPQPMWGTLVQRTWSRLTLWLFGVRVQLEGQENLQTQGVLYVFNHTSHFDIPAIYAALPGPLSFGAKAELFKIPFFGWAMKRFGVLQIERNHREKVLKLYEESIARAHKGENFVLAPEGTRQVGGGIGTFKSGPFIFAISGGLPIVPLVVVGGREVLAPHKLLPNVGAWVRTIHIKVLPPVSTQGWTIESRKELQEQLHKHFVESYNQQQRRYSQEPS